MQPQEYCRHKAAPPGSSLHYALLFTDQRTRADLLALNAYQREVTEIVDECSDRGVAAVKIGWWGEELDRIHRGQARHPVGVALQAAIHRGALTPDHLGDVIEGARMDLEYGAYPSFRELSVYCHRVGCTPAEIAVSVCGFRNPGTPTLGHDLGMGLQITRFLRNLRRHAADGRVYLPEDEMQRYGVERAALSADRTGEPLRALLGDLAERGRTFLTRAIDGVASEDRAAQAPLIITATLYRALLTGMSEDSLPVLERRHHLTPVRKLWLAWRTARRERRHATRRQKGIETQ